MNFKYWLGFVFLYWFCNIASVHAEISVTPNCRLSKLENIDSPSIKYIDQFKHIIEEVLYYHNQIFKEPSYSLPFKEVSINRWINKADVLSVEIIEDADQENIGEDGCITSKSNKVNKKKVLDAISIEGVCKVPVEANNLIRCSADMLRILLQGDRSSLRNRGALIFLLGHELSHIQDNHGSFIDPVKTINLKFDAKDKLKILHKEVCDERKYKYESDQEKRADERGLAILQRALKNSISSDGDYALSREQLIRLTSAKIWEAMSQIEKWGTHWFRYKEPGVPAYITSPPLPANAEYASWAANRLYCDIVNSDTGSISVPLFYSDHPDAAGRLGRLSKELEIMVKTGGDVNSHSPSSVVELTTHQSVNGTGALLPGNFGDLINVVGEAGAILNTNYGEVFESIKTQFCNQVNLSYNTGRNLNCEKVSHVFHNK